MNIRTIDLDHEKIPLGCMWWRPPWSPTSYIWWAAIVDDREADLFEEET